MRSISFQIVRYSQYVSRVLHTGVSSRQKNKLAILEHLFCVVNDFLHRSGSTYWITYGTLLGHVRDRALMPHDQDIDFALPVREYDGIIGSARRLPVGFSLHDSSRYHNGPKLYISYKGYDADLYFFRDAGENLQSCERDKNNSRYMLPVDRHLILPVRPAIFLGHETFVPAQADQYLSFVYGYTGADAKFNRVTHFWEKTPV